MDNWDVVRPQSGGGVPPEGLRVWAVMEVAVGAAVLVAAHILLARGDVRVSSWFYAIAWWPTILCLDGANFLLCSESLILTRRRTFLRLLPLSVTIWLVFELFNLRLQNWAYIHVPRQISLRWVGMVVSFATVLPAVFEIADLLQAIRLPRAFRVPPVRAGRRLLVAFVLIGMAFLVAPILFPAYAFPLIWGGFLFLLEPWCYLRGRPSLIRQLEGGSLLLFARLLLAGLIAGGVWEFFNFGALTKWVYTVPHFEGWKVFEMPLLGFLGFPPFAVACLVMANAVPLITGRFRVHPVPVFAVMLLFWAGAFWGIDRRTVASHVPLLSDISRLEPSQKARLRTLGITDPNGLVRRAERDGIDPIAESIGATRAEVAEWLEESRLMLHGGIGPENAKVLRANGIRSVGDLSSAREETLSSWLPTVRPPLIRLWLRSARDRN